jgi:glycerophosphoryl diester phosphodiesterase
VSAAISGNFAVEVDIQLSADGEAMVHHDDELGRLTDGTGALRSLTAAELKQVAFKDTPERMMTLGDLCDLTAGRVPLVIEVKSRFDGDRKLVKRMADVLAAYRGPAAGMSFDPDQVIALRELAPKLPRGIVAERHYIAEDWPEASPAQRADMTHLRHFFRTRPHFVSYGVNDLPAVAPWIARHIFGLPLLTWTVRTSEQRERTARYADQMTFEGFVPGT